MKDKEYRQTLLMTKWAGLSGTAALARDREGELEREFAKAFIREAAAFEGELSAKEDIALLEAAAGFGISYMKELGEEGVFGGLWELGEEMETALEVRLKDIPIRQHTVELCNFFDINPYSFPSEGSILLACDRGWELMHFLQGRGLSAAVIGYLTDGNDRVILYEDKERFLEPTRQSRLRRQGRYEEL